MLLFLLVETHIAIIHDQTLSVIKAVMPQKLAIDIESIWPFRATKVSTL